MSSAGPEISTKIATAYAAALQELLQGSYLMSPDELPDLLLRAVRHLGADEAFLYLVDYEQQVLTPLPVTSATPRSSASVDASLAGRAFQRIEVYELEADSASRRLWLPVLDGVERLGALELVVPSVEPLSEELRQAFESLTHLVAELLVSNGQYTDTYEWARRRQPMTLPAEMQHRLHPPLTFGTHRVVISGLLAPAYEVGGDAFDYALNGNIAHVAVFDAVGHGLHAALLANLAVACYRNCRRAGLPQVESVQAIDAALADGF